MMEPAKSRKSPRKFILRQSSAQNVLDIRKNLFGVSDGDRAANHAWLEDRLRDLQDAASTSWDFDFRKGLPKPTVGDHVLPGEAKMSSSDPSEAQSASVSPPSDVENRSSRWIWMEIGAENCVPSAYHLRNSEFCRTRSPASDPLVVPTESTSPVCPGEDMATRVASGSPPKTPYSTGQSRKRKSSQFRPEHESLSQDSTPKTQRLGKRPLTARSVASRLMSRGSSLGALKRAKSAPSTPVKLIMSPRLPHGQMRLTDFFKKRKHSPIFSNRPEFLIGSYKNGEKNRQEWNNNNNNNGPPHFKTSPLVTASTKRGLSYGGSGLGAPSSPPRLVSSHSNPVVFGGSPLLQEAV